MSARDDYPLNAWLSDVDTVRQRIEQHDAMCDRIDRLQAAVDRLRADAMTCTCGCNWNPHCAEHGVKSEWFQSDEQRAKRFDENEQLRDLQRRAREARERLRGSADERRKALGQ